MWHHTPDHSVLVMWNSDNQTFTFNIYPKHDPKHQRAQLLYSNLDLADSGPEDVAELKLVLGRFGTPLPRLYYEGLERSRRRRLRKEPNSFEDLFGC